MRVALVQQPLDHRQNNNNYFMNHVEWNDKNEIFIYLQNKTKNSFTIDFLMFFQSGWLKPGAKLCLLGWFLKINVNKLSCYKALQNGLPNGNNLIESMLL